MTEFDGFYYLFAVSEDGTEELLKLDQDELNKSKRKFTNLEKAKRVAIGRVGTSNYKYKGIKIYKYVCINRKPYRVEIFSKKRGITVSSK